MKQLNPKSVWLFFVPNLITITFMIIFISVSFVSAISDRSISFFNAMSIVFIIYIVLVVLTFVWAKLSYRFYKYELTDQGFRKESGVIYKKYTTIPYDRIQNVDINRGILARILGLSDLQIQTAGASATFSRNGAVGIFAEGRLPGVSKADAEIIRDELIERAKPRTSTGL